MPYCPNCGTEVEENVKFCEKCGTCVENETTVQTSVETQQPLQTEKIVEEKVLTEEQIKEEKAKTAKFIIENFNSSLKVVHIFSTILSYLVKLGLPILGCLVSFFFWGDFNFTNKLTSEMPNMIFSAVLFVLMVSPFLLVFDNFLFFFLQRKIFANWLQRQYPNAKSLAFAFDSIIFSKAYSTLYTSNPKWRLTIDTITESFLFLKHPKGKTLTITQMVCGIITTIVQPVVCGILYFHFNLSSLEVFAYLKSLFSSEGIPLLAFYLILAIEILLLAGINGSRKSKIATYTQELPDLLKAEI